jgi:hypothetical protein
MHGCARARGRTCVGCVMRTWCVRRTTENYNVEQDPATPLGMSEMLKKVDLRPGLHPLDPQHSFASLKISSLSLLGHLCCHRHGLRLVHLPSILNKQHSPPRKSARLTLLSTIQLLAFTCLREIEESGLMIHRRSPFEAAWIQILDRAKENDEYFKKLLNMICVLEGDLGSICVLWRPCGLRCTTLLSKSGKL